MAWKKTFTPSPAQIVTAGQRIPIRMTSNVGRNSQLLDFLAGLTLTVVATGTTGAQWVVQYGSGDTIIEGLDVRGTTSGATRTFTRNECITFFGFQGRPVNTGATGSEHVEDEVTLIVMSGTVTFTSVVAEADTEEYASLSPGSVDTQRQARFFDLNLPRHLHTDTDYQAVSYIVVGADELDTSASGMARISTYSGLDTYAGILVNGTPADLTPITFTNGVANFTLRFTSARPTGAGGALGFSIIPTTLGGVTFPEGAGYSTFAGIRLYEVSAPVPPAATARLNFTVQPPTTDEIGHVFTTPVQVSAINAAGAVNTTWGGDIVLTMKDVNGADATSFLQGSKTATPVLGVATFPTLYISKIGFFILNATSTVGTATLTGISTGITITGDDGEQSLRQNLRDDATIWVRTTNITSPTYGTFSDAEKSTLDGDEAVSANVTFDGTRWKFPFVLKCSLVRFKVSVSTLASAPTIQLYSSQDTTTGQDGTWTLVTSRPVTTTGVTIAQFSFGTPIFAKGLWLTLNDGGGAATASWYSQQAMGKYLGTSLSFLDVGSGSLDTENYVGIPDPFATIGGGATKFRNFQIRNNTLVPLSMFVTPTPARSTGDSLMDADNFFIIDDAGNNISGGFILPAFGSKLLQLRYTIGAGENDKSGTHYERISVTDVTQNDSLLLFADSNGGTAAIRSVSNIDDGTIVQQSGLGGGIVRGLFTIPGSQAWALSTVTPATTVDITRFIQGSNKVNPLNGQQTLQLTGWAGSEGSEVTGIGVIADKMVIALSTSTTLVVPAQAATYTGPISVARSTATTRTIPAQTTGAKRFQQGPGGTLYVSNGTAVGSVIYQLNSTAVVNTIDPTTPFGGRGLATFCYDAFNKELIVISALSAGSRVIARYSDAGALITSVSSTTESLLEVSGNFVLGFSLYVVYGPSLLYKHDLQTFANATLVSTLSLGDLPGDARLLN